VIARIYELPGGEGRLPAMEGVRAYAAFLVFLVHFVGIYSLRYRGIDLDRTHFSLSGGVVEALAYFVWRSHYGVDLFFFLSGFLIFRIVTGGRFGYAHFLKRRFLRIYPVFGAAVALYVAHAGFVGAPVRPANVLANLLLLNGVPELHVEPIIGPSWSLFFECAFYIVFPVVLLFRSRRRGVTGWHLLAFAAIVAATVGRQNEQYMRFLMFFGGALLACASSDSIATLTRRIPDRVALVAYLASTTFFVVESSFYLFTWVYLVTCFVFVLKVLYGNGFLNRIFRTRFLRYMGNISYSFFLVHLLVIVLVFDRFPVVWPWLGGMAHLGVVFACSVAAAIALATAFFLVFERPYFSWKSRSRRGEIAGAGAPALRA
jgi:exopolysaccharide production protein ExoZ